MDGVLAGRKIGFSVAESWRWGRFAKGVWSASLSSSSVAFLFKGTQDWDFFGFDFEICNISLLVMWKYEDFAKEFFLLAQY